MDDLLSEKEQIDQIRSWWSEYGAYVIAGIVLGGAILFGYNYYQNNKLQSQIDASQAYDTLVEHVADGDLDKAEQAAGDIAAAYADTTYAGPAGLAMARLYMDKNRDVDAAEALQGVLNGQADDEFKDIARLRLGRIYLYQDKAQEAVDLLESQDSSAFAAAYGEILGDAYTALGRVADAQTAYQQVLLDPLAQSTVDQQLVQWKSLDLPEVMVDDSDADEPETGAEVESEESAVEQQSVPEQESVQEQASVSEEVE